MDRPDILLTSPLPRAAETAEIAAHAFRQARAAPRARAGPRGTEAIINVLRRHRATPRWPFRGHEPTLSQLLARCSAVTAPSAWRSRSGAALVELPTEGRSAGRLVWFLRPGS